METKVNGIVIREIAFGENDAIITLFTLEMGTVTAKIKGVKKAGAKLKFASQPFCFNEYILSEKGDRKVVINASIVDSFYPIREDVSKYYGACIVAEFIKKFCLENIIAEGIFVLALNALKELAYSDKNPSEILVKFLISALDESGYGVDFERCMICGKKIDNRVFFDFNLGGGVCADCLDEEKMEISIYTYKLIGSIINGESKEYDINHLLRALKFLDYFINLKTGERLKSLEDFIKMQ